MGAARRHLVTGVSGFDRGGYGRIAVFVAVVGLASLKSIADAVGQSGVDPLPAVTALAPAAAVAALLAWRVPQATPRILDAETDVIVSLAPLLLGAWLVYWGPRKLGTQFFLFRPDLVGLVLIGAALGSLLLGARFAAGAARPLACCAVVCCPVVQLLAAGTGPGTARLAAASSLAGLPLAAGLGRRWRRRGLLLCAALAGGTGVGSAVGVGTGSAGATGLAAGLASSGAAALAAALMARRDHSPLARVPLAPASLGRVAVVALVACGAGLLDTLVPTLAAASPSAAGSPALHPGAASLSETVRSGVIATRWFARVPTVPAGRAMVLTTSGPSPSAAATYPTDSLLAWPVPACATRWSVRAGGRAVVVTLYSSTFTGYRWEQLEWGTRDARGYQRVDLVLSASPAGDGPVFPSLRSQVLLDFVRTSADFVANRQFDCGVLPLPLAAVPATVRALLSAAGGS